MKINKILTLLMFPLIVGIIVGVVVKYLPSNESPQVEKKLVNSGNINVSPVIKDIDSSTVINQTAINSPNAKQVAGDYIVKNEPRIIPEETIKKMQPALKASAIFTAEIKVPMSDSESFEFGEQLRIILQKAGWKIDKVWPVIADPPIKRGVKIYFGQRPNGALQAVFAPIYEQFGYEKTANFDKNMSPEVIRIYIGSK